MEQPLHGMAQFLQHDGFHQVVESADADRIDGIVIVRSDENDLEIRFPDLFEDFEAAHPWHLDIEEDDIRPMMADQQDRFFRPLGGRDHFQGIRKFLQFLPEVLQAARFVIYQYRGQDFHIERNEIKQFPPSRRTIFRHLRE